MRFMILCPAAIAAIEAPNLGDARERKTALAKKLERHLSVDQNAGFDPDDAFKEYNAKV